MGESYNQYICLFRFYYWSIRSNVVIGGRYMVCINLTIVVVHVRGTVSAHLNVERWNVVPQTTLEFFNRQTLSIKECISYSSPVTVAVCICRWIEITHQNRKMNWPVVAPFARLIFPSFFDWRDAVIVKSFVFASATLNLKVVSSPSPMVMASFAT